MSITLLQSLAPLGAFFGVPLKGEGAGNLLLSAAADGRAQVDLTLDALQGPSLALERARVSAVVSALNAQPAIRVELHAQQGTVAALALAKADFLASGPLSALEWQADLQGTWQGEPTGLGVSGGAALRGSTRQITASVMTMTSGAESITLSSRSGRC